MFKNSFVALPMSFNKNALSANLLKIFKYEILVESLFCESMIQLNLIHFIVSYSEAEWSNNEQY